MGRQLDEKVTPQVFSHQNNAEKHLTQSVEQRGKQKNKDMFYLYLFLNHGSKVEVLQEIQGKSL
jgi:undecaprenyl pyrophosphate synthase